MYCLCVRIFGYMCVYLCKYIVGPSCPCFLALGLQLHIAVPGFHVGSEDLNWVLMSEQQAPYPLSHLLNSFLFFFFFKEVPHQAQSGLELNFLCREDDLELL